MIQIQHRHIRIYKKIFIVLGAFVLFGSTLNSANAVEFGAVQYDHNNTYIDYSKFSSSAVKKSADAYFYKALESNNADDKKENLKKAAGEYFILTKINPYDLYAIDQIARIYDFEGKNSYAKGYFYKALEINKNHAPTNFYFGDYYYSRKEYQKALKYYNKALSNGYKVDYDILAKMGTMYEKLGDLQKANQYYKKAVVLKKDNDIATKIKEIEELKYSDTEYYKKRRKKK